MTDTANSEKHVFSLGDPEVTARCKITGRLFEVGSGATPHDQQTANFVRERDRAADMPAEGEQCLQTGRIFECGAGAHPKAVQTRQFLNDLSPAEKEQRRAAAAILHIMPPAGSA